MTDVGPALARARFDPERFSAVPVLATDRAVVLVVAFEPGQEIPLHAPEVDLVVTVASGSGELYADGQVYSLEPGDLAVVPAGETRGIRARSSRLVLVNLVTPPPTAADHARLDDGARWPDAGGETA